MNKFLLTAFLLFATQAYPIAIGDSLPKSTEKLKNIDEKESTLEGFVGKKGTLVIFSCNHCPWAKAWEDRIAALGNSYRTKEIGVVMINSNDPTNNEIDNFDGMKTRAKEKGFQFPYVMDGTSNMARLFGAQRTPEVFLFDGKGRLVYHGTIDDNAEKPDQVKKTYLKNALDQVVNGKPVTVSSTKAIGCSIKFRK